MKQRQRNHDIFWKHAKGQYYAGAFLINIRLQLPVQKRPSKRRLQAIRKEINYPPRRLDIIHVRQ